MTYLDGTSDEGHDYIKYSIYVERVLAAGDHVVLEGRTTGSHLGLPDAEEFNDPMVWVARIVDGAVDEWHLCPDMKAAGEVVRLEGAVDVYAPTLSCFLRTPRRRRFAQFAASTRVS